MRTAGNEKRSTATDPVRYVCEINLSVIHDSASTAGVDK